MMKVLVLEDHVGMCEMIGDHLEHADISVDLAKTYDDGCLYLMSSGTKYDALILDLLLDGHKDGEKFADEFKKANPESGIHVITASTYDEIKNKHKYSSIHHKPEIDFNLLIRKIKNNKKVDTDTKLIYITNKLDSFDGKLDSIENRTVKNETTIQAHHESIEEIKINCSEQRASHKSTIKWVIGSALGIVMSVVGTSYHNNRSQYQVAQDLKKEFKEIIQYEVKMQVDKRHTNITLSHLREIENDTIRVD